jgi:tRNA(fMet)-specific endonuclease VapC
MKYMLDTNICVCLIRQKSLPLLTKIQSCTPGDIGISAITVAELTLGVEKSQFVVQNHRALQQFLLPLVIAEFDHHAAAAYGRIRADLERKGMPIGSLDTLIGAHAVSLGSTLVTNNLKEFSRIMPLTIEDWTIAEGTL